MHKHFVSLFALAAAASSLLPGAVSAQTRLTTDQSAPSAAAVLQRSDADLHADLLASLEHLRMQHLSVRGVREQWSFTSMLGIPADQPPVTGLFDLLASNGRYRYRTDVSRSNPILTHYEIAFDGNRWQMFDREAGLLSYQRAEPTMNPMGIPNPMMLVWDFLSPDSDSCAACRLDLTDLASPQVWARVGSMRVAGLDAAGAIIADFPGGMLEGREFTYRVKFLGEPNRRTPATIERLALDGSTLTRMSLRDYQTFAGETGELTGPQTIVIEETCEQPVEPTPIGPVEPLIRTRPAGPFVYQLVAIDLTSRTAASVGAFRIDFAKARSIWDSDARVMVKTAK